MYHPLHLGVIHLDANQSGQVSIQVKVFTDDLENAIIHGQNSDFTMNYTDKPAIKAANRYIMSNIDIKQSGKNVRLKLQKVYPDRDVTIFDYSTTIKNDISFEVCCHIFYELFNDQTNLLIVNVVNEEEGYRLSSSKTCAHVE